MIDKPPPPPIFTDLTAFLTWAWVLGLSLLGGFASFLRKMKAGHARAWNFTELLGEMTAAALTGIITYNLCTWRDFPPQLTAAMVGIAAHMGSRALFRLEALVDTKFNLPTAPAVPSNKEPTHEAK
jgi:hypothetical protein